MIFSLCLLFVKTRCPNTIYAYSPKVQSYATLILTTWLQTQISTDFSDLQRTTKGFSSITFQLSFTISASNLHGIRIDKYKLNIGGGKYRTFYTIFVVDYNWKTGRYYLIGQIKAASNRITLIGVVSFNRKHT